MRFRMDATQYMRKLDGDATVGCSCLVRVKETGQVYTAQDKVMIDLPELDVKVRTTRMHSSRMRTVRCSSHLGGGRSACQGVSACH